MIRPHLRDRMPGRTRLVMAITERTIFLKCSDQASSGVSAAGVGGGPPVMLTRISMGPSAASTAPIRSSTTASSPRSQASA